MGRAAGTVVAGKVQLEGVSLPEGSAFTVLTPDATGDLFLDAEDEALASRSAQRTRDNEFVVLRFWPSQQLKQPRV